MKGAVGVIGAGLRGLHGCVRVRGAKLRGWLVAVTVAVGLLTPGSARAHEGPPLEVRWTGPDDCTAAEFVGAMDRLLVSSTVDVPISVEAVVVRDPAGWSITTDFDAGPQRSGRRSFQASQCTTVSQAAALAIAITVDPALLDRLAGPEPEQEQDPEQDPEPEPYLEPLADEQPIHAAASPTAERPRDLANEPIEPPLGPIEPIGTAGDRGPADPSARWRLLLGVAGLVDTGALPGLGAGLSVTAGALVERVRIEAEGTYRFPTRRSFEQQPGVGGELSQWTVGLRGCWAPAVGPIELPLCVGVDGGQTTAVATGLGDAQPRVRPWLAPVGTAGVAWPIRPWIAVTVRGSAAVPLLRHSFAIEGLGVLHTMGTVHGRGLLGLELRLR